MSEVALILHNIRSVHNVGSMFRTADAAGVSKIFLTGYTPVPVDRFGRVREDFAKVSLGAEKTVAWEHRARLVPLLCELRAQKVYLVAVEQDTHSVYYRNIKKRARTAFVFGNEVSGLPRSALNACDTIAEIPMRGKKESLNVAVAAGIILFSRP